jgi:tetratricopeptide (TPR) repeat protein
MMNDFTDDPDYFVQVGRELLALERREKVIRAFEHALRLDPASAYVHYIAAESLCDLGRTQEALLHYQEAARLDPYDPDPWLGIGWVAMQEERWQDECAAYDRALEIQPHCVTALINLGIAYQQLGLSEEAVRLLQQAEELALDDLEIPVILANAFQKAGNGDAARSTLKCAIEAHPTEHALVWQMGILLFEAEQFQEALAVWESLLCYRAQEPYLLLRIGDALKRLGRPEEALARYRQATEENPLFAFAYNDKANCLSELERYEEAAPVYQEALRMEPDHRDAALWLVNPGISLDPLERYEEAREAYLKALELRPDDVDALIDLGVNAAWSEQHEESIA